MSKKVSQKSTKEVKICRPSSKDEQTIEFSLGLNMPVYAFGLILISICILQNEAANQGGPASCHLRELELCSISATSIIQSPNGIPVGASEFKRQCEQLMEASDCVRDYSDKCLTEVQERFVFFLYGEVFEFFEELCANSSDLKTNYLKHAGCLRKVQKMHQPHCVTDFQAALESIQKLDMKVAFHTGCCNIDRLKGCILMPIQETCGNDAVDLVKSYMKRLIGKTLNITCRNHEASSNQCHALLTKPGTKPYAGRNTSAISRVISAYTLTPILRV